ncbi:hypothetical protein [Streptomyces bacillaris]|uniref:hypothetical protein n=1 Tax=Streptomyces bacillaris TaxID=68179 RepID=UPI003460E441
MDLTITVRVCDECKRRDRDATRYTLTPEEGKPRTRDLCDEDAAPLLAVFGEPASEARNDTLPAQGRAPKKAPAKNAADAPPRRRGKTPVATLAEIEARKAAAQKP